MKDNKFLPDGSIWHSLPTFCRLLPTNLVRESDSRLKMALCHVVAVHPENIGVMVRVFESHDIHFSAQRNLSDVIYLYRTDSSASEFFGIERICYPIHVAAMVHVLVHVQVAVLCNFLPDNFRF